MKHDVRLQTGFIQLRREYYKKKKLPSTENKEFLNQMGEYQLTY